MTELGDSSFYALIPPNLKSAQTKALSAALDRQFEALAVSIQTTLIYVAIDALAENLCDFLALMFDIRAYDFSFPLKTKREMIKLGLGASAYLGTAKALRDLLGTIYAGDVRVKEWFDYDGEPYRFRIALDADKNSFTPGMEAEMKPVTDCKNLRSHLDGLEVVRRKQARIYLASVGAVWSCTSVAPRSAIGSRRTGEIKAGCCPVQYTRLFIRPSDNAVVHRQSTQLVAACGRAEIIRIKIPAYRRDI